MRQENYIKNMFITQKNYIKFNMTMRTKNDLPKGIKEGQGLLVNVSPHCVSQLLEEKNMVMSRFCFVYYRHAL
jgi:hypothetical protein